VANGTPDQLKKKAKGAGQIRFQIAGIPASATKSDLEGLANVSSVDVNLEEENMLRGVVVPKEGQSARASEDIFKYVSSKNGLLQELAVLEGRLDDVFREITETSL
jgi:ABC-type multidrug transport system ATPase subunit